MIENKNRPANELQRGFMFIDYISKAMQSPWGLKNAIREDIKFALAHGLEPELQDLGSSFELPEKSHVYRHKNRLGELFFDAERNLVYSPLRPEDDRWVQLSRTEGIILEQLMKDPIAVITSDALYKALYGRELEPSRKDLINIAPFISRLRKKLYDESQKVTDAKTGLIHTVSYSRFSLTSNNDIIASYVSTQEIDMSRVKFDSKITDKIAFPVTHRVRTRYGDLLLCSDRGLVISPLKPETIVKLDSSETEILQTLMEQPERSYSTVSLAQLRYQISDEPLPSEKSAIAVFVSKLRTKLGDVPCVCDGEEKLRKRKLIINDQYGYSLTHGTDFAPPSVPEIVLYNR